MEVAKARSALYGINDAEFRIANAADVESGWISSASVVIFFACLEHMTLDEKISSLSKAWENMKPGAHLAIVGTPNRLWWYDGHTSRLPFYNWLPDDLAIHYARHSPRSPFNSDFAPPVENKNLLDLTRVGRAISYQELELAIPELHSIKVKGMNSWMRRRNPVEFAKWIATTEAIFESLLVRYGPGLDRAYFTPFLNIALRKP